MADEEQDDFDGVPPLVSHEDMIAAGRQAAFEAGQDMAAFLRGASQAGAGAMPLPSPWGNPAAQLGANIQPAPGDEAPPAAPGSIFQQRMNDAIRKRNQRDAPPPPPDPPTIRDLGAALEELKAKHQAAPPATTADDEEEQEAQVQANAGRKRNQAQLVVEQEQLIVERADKLFEAFTPWDAFEEEPAIRAAFRWLIAYCLGQPHTEEDTAILDNPYRSIIPARVLQNEITRLQHAITTIKDLAAPWTDEDQVRAYDTTAGILASLAALQESLIAYHQGTTLNTSMCYALGPLVTRVAKQVTAFEEAIQSFIATAFHDQETAPLHHAAATDPGAGSSRMHQTRAGAGALSHPAQEAGAGVDLYEFTYLAPDDNAANYQAPPAPTVGLAPGAIVATADGVRMAAADQTTPATGEALLRQFDAKIGEQTRTNNLPKQMELECLKVLAKRYLAWGGLEVAGRVECFQSFMIVLTSVDFIAGPTQITTVTKKSLRETLQALVRKVPDAQSTLATVTNFGLSTHHLDEVIESIRQFETLHGLLDANGTLTKPVLPFLKNLLDDLAGCLRVVQTACHNEIHQQTNMLTQPVPPAGSPTASTINLESYGAIPLGTGEPDATHEALDGAMLGLPSDTELSSDLESLFEYFRDTELLPVLNMPEVRTALVLIAKYHQAQPDRPPAATPANYALFGAKFAAFKENLQQTSRYIDGLHARILLDSTLILALEHIAAAAEFLENLAMLLAKIDEQEQFSAALQTLLAVLVAETDICNRQAATMAQQAALGGDPDA